MDPAAAEPRSPWALVEPFRAVWAPLRRRCTGMPCPVWLALSSEAEPADWSRLRCTPPMAAGCLPPSRCCCWLEELPLASECSDACLRWAYGIRAAALA